MHRLSVWYPRGCTTVISMIIWGNIPTPCVSLAGSILWVSRHLEFFHCAQRYQFKLRGVVAGLSYRKHVQSHWLFYQYTDSAVYSTLEKHHSRGFKWSAWTLLYICPPQRWWQNSRATFSLGAEAPRVSQTLAYPLSWLNSKAPLTGHPLLVERLDGVPLNSSMTIRCSQKNVIYTPLDA